MVVYSGHWLSTLGTGCLLWALVVYSGHWLSTITGMSHWQVAPAALLPTKWHAMQPGSLILRVVLMTHGLL
jgi:hypothetical protein